MIPIPAWAIKPLLYAGAVIGVVVALWVWGERREAQGRAECEAAYKLAAAKEQQRQADINAAAQRRAEKAVAALQSGNEKLEAQLKANAEAAARDPMRDRCALSPDSVRRLDAIR